MPNLPTSTGVLPQRADFALVGLEPPPLSAQEQARELLNIPSAPAKPLMGPPPPPLMGPPAPPTPSPFMQNIHKLLEPDPLGAKDVKIRQERLATLKDRPAFTKIQQRNVGVARQFLIPLPESNAILRGSLRSKKKESGRLEFFGPPEKSIPGMADILGSGPNRVGIRDLGQPVPPIAQGVSPVTMTKAIVGARLLERRDDLRGESLPVRFERTLRDDLSKLSDLSLRQRFEIEMARLSVQESTRPGLPEVAIRSALASTPLGDLGPVVEQYGRHFGSAASAGISDFVLEERQVPAVDDILTLYKQDRIDEMVGAIIGEVQGFVTGAPGKAIRFVGGKLPGKTPMILRGAVELGAAGAVEAPVIAARGAQEGRTVKEISVDIGATVAMSFFAGLGLSSIARLMTLTARAGGKAGIASARFGIRQANQLLERSIRGLQAVADKVPERLNDLLPIVTRMSQAGKELETAARKTLGRKQLFAIARALGFKDSNKALDFLRKEAGTGLRQLTPDEMGTLATKLQKRVRPGKPPTGPPGKPPVGPPPPSRGPEPSSEDALNTIKMLDDLAREPLPLGMPGMSEPSSMVSNIIMRSAIRQPLIMIEKMGGESGTKLVQAFKQFDDLKSAMKGRWGERLRQINNLVPGRQRQEWIQIAGGRAKLSAEQENTALGRAVRDLRQLDDDVMQVMEAEGILKQDGTAFRRLTGGYFPQPLDKRFIDAIHRFAQEGLRRKSAAGLVRPLSQKQWKDYNTSVDAVVENFERRGVRYDTATKTVSELVEGQTVSPARLRREAQHWLNDHRGRLTGEFHRLHKFNPRDVAGESGSDTGFPVIPEGTVMLHREMIWPLKMIRQDFVANYDHHLMRLTEKAAESRMFKPKNEILNELHQATLREAEQLGGPGNRAAVDSLIRNLWERQVRVPVARREFGFDPGETSIERGINFARTITSRLLLGPLTPFASGRNAIFGIYGLTTRVPVLKGLGNLGLADVMVGAGIGGTAGFLSGLREDAPPSQLATRTFGGVVAGGAAGAAISMARGTTLRRLLVTPPVIGQLARLSRFVERKTTQSLEKAFASGALEGQGMEEVFMHHPLRSALIQRGVGQLFTDISTGMVLAVEQWLRASSANAVASVVQGFQKKLVSVANQGQLNTFLKTGEGRTILRELNRFGIGRETAVNFAQRGELLSDTLLNRARREGVRATQYTLRPMDTPIAWSSPWGRFWTQFIGMNYREFVNTVGVALYETGQWNFKPVVKVSMIGVAAGLSSVELADWLSGRDLTPTAKRKVQRLIRIMGSQFDVAGIVTDQLSREGEPGQIARDVVTPPSASIGLDAIGIMTQEMKELSGIADEPLQQRRGTLEKLLRLSGTVRTIQGQKARGTLKAAAEALGLPDSVIEFLSPSDKDVLRQFRAQARNQLTEQIDAVESGGPIERLSRRGAAALQLPGIGAEAEDVNQDLRDLQQKMLQGTALDAQVERNVALGKGPQTRAEAVDRISVGAQQAVLTPIVNDMQRALQKNDLDAFNTELMRYFKGNGNARALLGRLKTRAGDPTKKNFFAAVEADSERIFRMELDVRKFTRAEAIERLRLATETRTDPSVPEARALFTKEGRDIEAQAIQSFLREAHQMTPESITALTLTRHRIKSLLAPVRSVVPRTRRKIRRSQQQPIR